MKGDLAKKRGKGGYGMKKVLVVDDSTTIRKLFQIIFKKRSEEIDFAEDGERGISKIKEFSPDIIFLDANMPGKSGWEVLEYVKKKYPNIYVILMTAEEEVKSSTSPDKILRKPFQMGDVRTILDTLL